MNITVGLNLYILTVSDLCVFSKPIFTTPPSHESRQPLVSIRPCSQVLDRVDSRSRRRVRVYRYDSKTDWHWIRQSIIDIEIEAEYRRARRDNSRGRRRPRPHHSCNHLPDFTSLARTSCTCAQRTNLHAIAPSVCLRIHSSVLQERWQLLGCRLSSHSRFLKSRIQALCECPVFPLLFLRERSFLSHTPGPIRPFDVPDEPHSLDPSCSVKSNQDPLHDRSLLTL
jgi:hypothetical protein